MQTDCSRSHPIHSRLATYAVLPAVALALLLPSCVVRGPGGRPLVAAGVGVGYYNSLPAGYSSPYYYSGNRYYYGGTWERGRFLHGGRYYDGRYLHNGHYIYGGRFNEGQVHSRPGVGPAPRPGSPGPGPANRPRRF